MMPSTSSNSSILHSTNPTLSSSLSSSSPCAACKFLRRKCQPECVFAPYFPPDNPQKFIHVHRVFGASNVTKILNELPTIQREDAVNSLAYEAEMRLKDPVYGCVGVISILQQQLHELQAHLRMAKAELAKLQNYPSLGITTHNHMGFGFGRDHLGHYPYQQQQMLSRSFDGDQTGGVATRVGLINGGGYDAGMVTTASGGGGTNLGVLGLQFLKPSTNGGPTIGP